MPPLTKLVALYSGQGMAHVVEFYDDETKLDYPNALALVDFGGNVRAAANAAGYVVGLLQKQRDHGINPRINLLVVSHQDRDHHLLLKSLLEAINQKTMRFTLDAAYLGGAGWTPTNVAAVNAFLDASYLRRPPPYALEPYRCDYKPLDHLFERNGVAIRVVVGQVAIPTTEGKDIICNGSSAVIAIENSSSAILLPGDATHHTMKNINDLFDEWAMDDSLPSLSPVQAMEIPHHGAIRTTVENYVATKNINTFDVAIADEFARNIAAKGVWASAGPFNRYGHPIEEVIRVFGAFADTLPATHNYVSVSFEDKRVGGGDWGSYYRVRSTDRWIKTTVTYVQYVPGLKASDRPMTYTNIEIPLKPDGVTAILVHRNLTEILADPGAIEPPDPPEDEVVYAPAHVATTTPAGTRE